MEAGPGRVSKRSLQTWLVGRIVDASVRRQGIRAGTLSACRRGVLIGGIVAAAVCRSDISRRWLDIFEYRASRM